MEALSAFHQKLQRQKFALTIIIVIALIPRAVLILAQSAIIWPDSVGYFRSAVYMLVNHTVTSELISHSPLYPMFLAFFLKLGVGPQIGIAILITQHLLGLLGVVLVYLAARKIFNPVAAFYSSVLLSAHSVLLCYECVIESEILLFFALSLTLYFTVRALATRLPTDYVLTGFACALAALSRPAAQLYIVCILLVMCLALKDLRRYSRALFLILGTYLVVIAPFIFANYQKHGFIGLSHGEGLNLISRVFDVDHLKPVQNSRYPELKLLYDKIAWKPHQICCRFHRRLTHKLHYSALQADEAMFKISLETLLAHPFEYIENSLVLLYKFFTEAKNSVKPCPPGVGVLGCKRERRIPPPFLLHPTNVDWLKPILRSTFRFPSFIGPWFVLCSALGILIYFLSMRTPQGFNPKYVYGLLLVLTALYFGVVTAAFRKPHDRYRFPADPALIMFTVWFVHELVKYLKKYPLRICARNFLNRYSLVGLDDGPKKTCE